MIILAKAVSYGGNAIRYATEKEKAEIIRINHMPQDITPISMWHRMQLHCQLHQTRHTHGRPMQNFMVSFVLSPSPDECEGWARADWDALQREVLHELDHTNLSHLPGCSKSKPTHFADSMSVAALHRDSKSGKLHLHVDCCRLDMDGNTNDIHQIHIRAMRAAQAINRRHGWLQPDQIREDRREQMSADCMEVLRSMPKWHQADYFARLEAKGYKVKLRTDSKGVLRGYSLAMGATIVKASELGTSRKLMASRLEDTWRKLHKADYRFLLRQASQRDELPITDNGCHAAQPIHNRSSVIGNPSSIHNPLSVIYNHPIYVDGKTYHCPIPNFLFPLFKSQSIVPDDALWSTPEQVMHTAMLLFCGYLDAATTIAETSGGGGSTPSDWGKGKDEDDEAWARRCINQAKMMHTRRRSRHR